MTRLLFAALSALAIVATSVHADETVEPVDIRGDMQLAYAEPFVAPDLTEQLKQVLENPAELPLAQVPPRADQRPMARPEGLYEHHVLANLPHTLKGQSDFMCLAVAIYHEARGESREGQAAVASVILQRAAVPNRWGSTACEVVVPVQFSFLRSDRSFAPITDFAAWERAKEVATVAIVEGPDPWLDGADHYHTKNVNPSWNREMPVVAHIGDHIFYADPRSARITG